MSSKQRSHRSGGRPGTLPEKHPELAHRAPPGSGSNDGLTVHLSGEPIAVDPRPLKPDGELKNNHFKVMHATDHRLYRYIVNEILEPKPKEEDKKGHKQDSPKGPLSPKKSGSPKKAEPDNPGESNEPDLSSFNTTWRRANSSARQK